MKEKIRNSFTKVILLAGVLTLPLFSFSQELIFKSDPTNELIFEFRDSSYTYRENYERKPGEDLGYHYKSKGYFKFHKDTVTLFSEMPGNEFLPGHIHKLSATELQANQFSYIYPIKEQVTPGYVKIYFDNIADPEKYLAYEVTASGLKAIPIQSFKKLEKDSIVHTDNDNIRLFHYLIIKKPAGNKLLIMATEDHQLSKSYFFDLEKVPFSTFHFYTRVYSNYYDLTGLKFIISSKLPMKMVKQQSDLRYWHTLLSDPLMPYVRKY
jgi:hypothetical protein